MRRVSKIGTEVLETIFANKFLITIRFHQLFWDQSQLLIKLANADNSNTLKCYPRNIYS